MQYYCVVLAALLTGYLNPLCAISSHFLTALISRLELPTNIDRLHMYSSLETSVAIVE
jgi:hypothetical protein